MNEEVLDFEGLAASSSATVWSEGSVRLMVVAAMVAFGAVIAASIWLANRFADTPSTRVFVTLREFPPALKLVALGVCANALIVQGLAVIDVYMHTQVIHQSAHEYFQDLSWARLLGISHAHVFGFMVLYGTLAVLLGLSSVRARHKYLMVSVLIWSSLFDVAAWWGMKAISAGFEWLAALSGAGSSLASLAAVVAIVRDLRRGGNAAL